MVSDFDQFMGDAYGDARGVFGEEKFRISGKTLSSPIIVSGSWNEVGTTSEPTMNGPAVTFSAIVQIAVSEFGKREPVAGQKVTRLKNGLTYRIVGEVHRDTLTFTFPLQTVHQ